MRYADAEHVDLGGFRLRKPVVGRLYWFIGVGLCVVAAVYSTNAEASRWLVLIAVIGWLRAWQQAVGTAWRTPLVLAALIAAVHATPWSVVGQYIARSQP